MLFSEWPLDGGEVHINVRRLRSAGDFLPGALHSVQEGGGGRGQKTHIMATLGGSQSPSQSQSPAPRTGGKRRKYSDIGNGNIVTKITSCQITGHGFNRGTQVTGRAALLLAMSTSSSLNNNHLLVVVVQARQFQASSANVFKSFIRLNSAYNDAVYVGINTKHNRIAVTSHRD